ncbi:hypothetical protein DSO57_1019106 [Entomophthora muscae]|uniref:Uncharacterized protein n=1 Tax=Entomophthora muscae TaxID=34485 RepID=A0ACC2UDX4_9FUNG|nr:hypothetical protein DSO57_1019106 [Entomophthora muscae]
MFTIPQPHMKPTHVKPEGGDVGPLPSLTSPHSSLHYPPPSSQWANQQRYQYQYLTPQFQDSPRPLTEQLTRTNSHDYEPIQSNTRYAPRNIPEPHWQQTYEPRWDPRWEQTSSQADTRNQVFQTSVPSPQRDQYPYPMDGMGFPIMGTSVDPFQNFMYSSGIQGFDPALMKNMMMASDADMSVRKKGASELNNVLPVVMTGPRPYSPAITHPSFAMKGGLNNGPICCSQKIRVPSHLLLTNEQRNSMEEISVVKRVFDVDDLSTARVFLGQNGLLPEQLSRPLNKWKTRNTRKRKHATTHLYQCCCGSDVKQFHGTKGTRRSKQKYPFVSCLAFVEVARRTEDGSLIWARGLMDHSSECQKAQPFASQ